MAHEKEPQNQEVSPKKYLATLPDNQVVSVQGPKKIWVLASVNNAFRRDGSSVDTEELTAPDISLGIPRRQAQQSIWNAVHNLNRENLNHLGWDIYNIPVRDGPRSSPGSFGMRKFDSEEKKLSMVKVTLTDKKTVVFLPSRPAQMLRDLMKVGRTREELQKPHVDAGKKLDSAKSIVTDDLASIRRALDPTPFEVANDTTPQDKGKGIGGKYIYRKRSPEQLRLQEELLKARETKQAEVARQKQQASLQVALNIFKAVRSGKLQTLDKNATAHVKSFLPPNATEQDAKTILLESINIGLNYWNRNEWEFTQNSLAEELELVIICQDLRIRPRHNQERARQEILSYFNLL